jgi:hypothetical protein
MASAWAVSMNPNADACARRQTRCSTKAAQR